MSIIRYLLLKLESIPIPYGVATVSAASPDLQTEEYTKDQIEYHLSLIVEAGLVITNGVTLNKSYLFQRLSWSGHDFLDSVRDEDTWNKTNNGAVAAGGFTLDLIKDLAKGFIRKKIEEQTGISI